jgi:dipeptidyl aminopeptidase/acylaminoacyl peptidase
MIICKAILSFQEKINKDGYKNGSPIAFAHQIKGNLLIVHGIEDEIVYCLGIERLINKISE